MYSIQLTNFRCFYEPTSLEVRPVTFLVGENSAGKTTFMAGARLLIEGFTRSPQNPFNRDPYFLGGFDQIAHYRGGVKGRAKYFSLEIAVPAGEAGGPSGRKLAVPTVHKMTFVKGSSPQPDLSTYEFSTPDAAARLDLTDKAASLKVTSQNKEIFSFTPKRSPAVGLLRKDLSYLRYVFEELQFTVLHNPRGEGVPAPNPMVAALIQNYMLSARSVQRRIFASAPIRTQPLRTYTPSEIEPSSEGAHVPLEMARQKISFPIEWDTLHERMINFGNKSGLFEDIDVRLLGKRDGDPFQVVVKTKSQPFNLIDVGYGVSQALPIVYQLEQSRQYDTFFLQQPEVHLHPRAQAELGSLIARLSKQRANSLFMLETHSDYLIDRVRTEVAAGKLDHRNVTIIFFDKREHEVEATNIYLSEKGEIRNAPLNFRAFFLEEHSRLLGL